MKAMLKKFNYREVTWIDLENPKETEIDLLVKDYPEIHPFALNELIRPTTRSRLDAYHDFIYLALQLPRLSSDQSLNNDQEQEIDIILGRNLVLTAHIAPVASFDDFAKIFESHLMVDKQGSKSSPIYMIYRILRELYNDLASHLDQVNQDLKQIEQRVFAGEERRMVESLARINRVLLDFRWSLRSHRQILYSLEPTCEEIFGNKYGTYFNGLIREYEKVWQMLDSNQEAYLALSETNNSLLSIKTNEIMKVLTVVAFLFLPVTFLSQILGMSLPIPIASLPHAFWLVLGVMLAFLAYSYWFARRHQWL